MNLQTSRGAAHLFEELNRTKEELRIGEAPVFGLCPEPYSHYLDAMEDMSANDRSMRVLNDFSKVDIPLYPHPPEKDLVKPIAHHMTFVHALMKETTVFSPSQGANSSHRHSRVKPVPNFSKLHELNATALAKRKSARRPLEIDEFQFSETHRRPLPPSQLESIVKQTEEKRMIRERTNRIVMMASQKPSRPVTPTLKSLQQQKITTDRLRARDALEKAKNQELQSFHESKKAVYMQGWRKKPEIFDEFYGKVKEEISSEKYEDKTNIQAAIKARQMMQQEKSYKEEINRMLKRVSMKETLMERQKNEHLQRRARATALIQMKKSLEKAGVGHIWYEKHLNESEKIELLKAEQEDLITQMK